MQDILAQPECSNGFDFYYKLYYKEDFEKLEIFKCEDNCDYKLRV